MPSSKDQQIVQTTYRTYSVKAGVPQSDTGTFVDGTALISSDVRDSTLTKTPGWTKMRLKPIQPYTMSRDVTTAPITTFGRTFNYRYFEAGEWFSGFVNGQGQNNAINYGASLTVPVMELIEDPIPYASRKLLAKLNTAKSSSAVMLAELPKTVKSVAKTATKLAHALRALRRFDIDGVAKALEVKVSTKQRVRMQRKKREYLLNPSDSDILSVSKVKRYRDASYDKTVIGDRYRTKDFFGDLWLEYSYGWKPLLSDVYSHAEALATQLVERQYVVRFADAKHQTEGRRTLTEDHLTDWKRTRKVKVSKYGAVGVRYSNENVNALNVFGLLNPAQVAWELVPFSFVADWFLPVGNAIESLSATDGLTFHSGYSSYKTHVTVNCVVSARPAYGTADNMFTPYGSGTADKVEVRFDRSRLTSFPQPTFPAFKDWRSLSHGASAIALLNSLFLSKK